MPKKKKIEIKNPNEKLDLTRKRENCKTVKTSLRSIVMNKNVQTKVNELAMRCNDIVIDTYQFIRLYCLYQYKNDKDNTKT